MLPRILRHALLALVVASVAYLVLLAYPQPLFAYELTHAGLTVHADAPIPETMRATLPARAHPPGSQSSVRPRATRASLHLS
jgi:hypothetical protein